MLNRKISNQNQESCAKKTVAPKIIKSESGKLRKKTVAPKLLKIENGKLPKKLFSQKHSNQKLEYCNKIELYSYFDAKKLQIIHDFRSILPAHNSSLKQWLGLVTFFQRLVFILKFCLYLYVQ